MPASMPASTEIGAWLFAIDDEDFSVIVAQDSRGQVDEEASAALRHPLALRRWLASITLLLGDAKTQVAEKKPKGFSEEVAANRDPEFGDWYRKLVRWRQSLLWRKEEAEHLIAEQRRLYGKGWEHKAVQAAKSSEEAARKEQAAEALAAGENGTSRKVRKRMAGERAIERLIELHRDEFSRIIDEEHAALDVPDDVRARLARLVRAGLTLRAAETFAHTSWPAGEIAQGVRIEVAENSGHVSC